MNQAIVNPSPTAGRRSTIRTPEVAVGALVIALCVIGAMVWGRSAVAGTRVLVVRHDLHRGDVIDESDLATVTLTSSDDIALLPVTAAESVVGMRVVVDVDADTPLTAAQLSSAGRLSATEGLVGLTVAPGEAPGELASGDTVRLLTSSRNPDGSVTAVAEPPTLEVWDISAPDPLDGTRVVTLKVDVTDAPTLLGRDEIRLMKVSE
ncbi:MAG: SAF domain-containing protein [Actinomycetota bacterium]